MVKHFTGKLEQLQLVCSYTSNIVKSDLIRSQEVKNKHYLKKINHQRCKVMYLKHDTNSFNRYEKVYVCRHQTK